MASRTRSSNLGFDGATVAAPARSMVIDEPLPGQVTAAPACLGERRPRARRILSAPSCPIRSRGRKGSHCRRSPHAPRTATGVGKSGGRTVSAGQPRRKPSAGPQTRPWQAPMPARVASLASRAEEKPSRRLKATSSQRQTSVSGRASRRSSSRSAKVSASPAPKASCRSRRRASALGDLAPRGGEPGDRAAHERVVDARDPAELAGGVETRARSSPVRGP